MLFRSPCICPGGRPPGPPDAGYRPQTRWRLRGPGPALRAIARKAGVVALAVRTTTSLTSLVAAPAVSDVTVGSTGRGGPCLGGASKCPRSWSKAAWQRRNGIRSPAEAASAGWPLADGPGCCGRGYGLNFQLDHATAMFAYSTNNVAREAFFPVHAARQDGARPEASGRWRSPS